MAVLAELCRRPGEVVSADSLLDACWPGEALGDNPVHKVMAGLRRSLQDSATAPRYIETIRKQGYRLVAPIRVLSGQGPRSHQGGWRGQSPFRGLESFGVEHASVFFGRDGAVAELHARLAAQWQRGHPMVDRALERFAQVSFDPRCRVGGESIVPVGRLLCEVRLRECAQDARVRALAVVVKKAESSHSVLFRWIRAHPEGVWASDIQGC